MTRHLLSIIEEKVVRIPESGCWIWPEGRHARLGGMNVPRFMLAQKLGREPKVCCHKCDVPWCVNPDHLYDGDYRTNMQDAIERGQWVHYNSKKTECPKCGAPYIRTDGKKTRCKPCEKKYQEAYRAKNLAL